MPLVEREHLFHIRCRTWWEGVCQITQVIEKFRHDDHQHLGAITPNILEAVWNACGRMHERTRSAVGG
jgi:hypothetical protein